MAHDDVAAAVPPVWEKGALVVLGGVVVAAGGVGAPRVDGSGGAVLEVAAQGIEDPELVGFVDRTALGAVDHFVGVVDSRGVDESLGHPEDLLELRAEHGAHLRGPFVGEAGATDLQQPQCGQLVASDLVLVVDPPLGDGRYRRAHGDSLGGDRREGSHRLRAREHHRACADQERPENAGARQGEVVTGGKGAQVHVVRGQLGRRRGCSYVAHVVVVGAGDELR